MITRKQGGGRKLGVRHLQLIFAGLHATLDGIGRYGVSRYLHIVKMGDIDGSRSEERLFSEKDIQLVDAGVFMTAAFTRLVAPFPILTLNNKYFSIVITLFEVLTYCFVRQAYSMVQFYGVVALCLLLSICQSIRLPIALNMISKWIPPREHTRALVVVTCGNVFGAAFAQFLYMIPYLQNNLLFILAGLKALHTVAYFLFGAQDPQTCWILRKAEWHYLCREIGFRRKIQCSWHVPLSSIMRTPMIYGLMCSSIASKWFYVDHLHFKHFVPGYDDAVNISSMIYPILQFGAAWGVDVMIFKEIVTRNNLRKICSCFVFWGGSIAICFMCFYSREPSKVVAHYIIASYFGLGVVISEIAAVFDMSPNYAVELHAIYSFPSWATAAIKAVFVDPKYPLTGSNPFRENIEVWYETAFVMFVLNYGFLMFGDINRCQFDSLNAVDWRKESQISYP